MRPDQLLGLSCLDYPLFIWRHIFRNDTVKKLKLLRCALEKTQKGVVSNDVICVHIIFSILDVFSSFTNATYWLLSPLPPPAERHTLKGLTQLSIRFELR